MLIRDKAHFYKNLLSLKEAEKINQYKYFNRQIWLQYFYLLILLAAGIISLILAFSLESIALSMVAVALVAFALGAGIKQALNDWFAYQALSLLKNVVSPELIKTEIEKLNKPDKKQK